MKSILSIQSHVAYGFCGNKAATYPLQSLGYDVWAINTVQFSNHTGYGKYQGTIFNAKQILNLAQGIIDLNVVTDCQAILTGYLGNADIGNAVLNIVKIFKQINPYLIYLCDPVIDDRNCHITSEVKDFFKKHLQGDIITPNQYEAENLSKIPIKNLSDLNKVANYFHALGIKIVIITGIILPSSKNLSIFASQQSHKKYLISNINNYEKKQINGTGDLFSALFLGFYLRTKNLAVSLKKAIYCLQSVITNTVRTKNKELQILSVNYLDDNPKDDYKIEIF